MQKAAGPAGTYKRNAYRNRNGTPRMFTGIVETTGEVIDREETADGLRLRIAADGLDEFTHGQSIAVSGVCLTVERYDDDWFEVFCAAETVAQTYLGTVTEGTRLNIERALAATDRFDGHLVQGHVDTTAAITAIERIGDDWRFSFDIPDGYGRYIVHKGSVALDGISLTVADRRDDEFDVAIIPTTYDLTTLNEKTPGDPVHLEVDIVAKYVEQLLEGYRD